ncbi:putative orphan protein [hydrothermal vent metagenome]|uniref:Putative orphan protein n=1 Tax=hydrothermal vent metagenome TaxID=652676 RepID=A0A1W1CWT4_9ZZZZ
MDKRKNRVQPIRLSPDFFPLDIHKSMFINDLTITIPAFYVKSWGDEILDKHNKDNRKWEVNISYESPKELGREVYYFKANLTLSFIKNRNKESSYRLKWDNEFAVQLAKDYPKSFVRALEFHIGDEYYKELKYTEFDIGGFKEQLQVKIKWENNEPIVMIKEFFRVKDEAQGFPKVFKELSSYLIADYLLSTEDELLRRIQITDWKRRTEITKEVNENNIYILLNREEKKVYFGETKQSLSQRYPLTQKHHSFEGWNEYSIIQLPPETSDHTRLLIERVLIAVGSKLFPNFIMKETPVLNQENGLELQNKKK